MRTTGFIAGGLGLTLVGGLLLVGGAIGVVALVVAAPDGAVPASDLRAAVERQSEELAWCAAGTTGGSLVATVVVRNGEPTHVAVGEGRLDSEAARCVADTLVSMTWPEGSGAARIPITLSP